MKNFVQQGHVLTAIAPAGGAASGNLYFVGLIFGIAATSAAAGEEYELALGNVNELPKTSAEAWAMGEAIYWNAAGSITTNVATGNTKIGVAAQSAANPSGIGVVRLNDQF